MHTHNVDHREIEKFSAHANDWWNPEGTLKTLHLIDPIRLQFIQEQQNLANAVMLDVGCGGGIFSESLAKQGARVTAIDMSVEALAVARTHAASQHLTIDYQHATAEDFAQQYPAHFTGVVCMELLEHVPDPMAIVQACAQLVVPGGYVFFSTLNRTCTAYLHAILGAEYLLKLLPQGTHDYRNFIRPAELSAWARAAHLTLRNMAGIRYALTSKRFYRSKEVSVNYMACYQRTD
jgi:2-polyprenyl-6-hydroxyphenyl methylase / 3-demethylubiquinone-9 3-methyltransferase